MEPIPSGGSHVHLDIATQFCFMIVNPLAINSLNNLNHLGTVLQTRKQFSYTSNKNIYASYAQHLKKVIFRGLNISQDDSI